MRSKALLVAIVLFAVMVNFTATEALLDGEYWLDGYEYRKQHTINTAAGAGTNYAVQIIVDYGAGADSGNTVYVNGECQTDFDDIRFTNETGTGELDYFLVDKTDSDHAHFRVEILGDLSTTAQKIYVYYGNSTVSSASDGVATFPELFDHFDDASINATLWDTGGTPTESGTVIVMNANNEYIRSDDTWDNASFCARTMMAAEVDDNEYMLMGFSSIVSGGTKPGNNFITYDGDLKSSSADAANFEQTSIYNAAYFGSYHIWEQRWKDNTRVEYYIDDTLLDTDTTYPDDTSESFQAYCYDTTDDLTIDWAFVRKYVYPEPAHGAWGAEESDDYYTDHLWATGFYFENGTAAAGREVTVTLENGTSWEYYLDGNQTHVRTNETIIRVTWPIDFDGVEGIRFIDVASSNETHTLFVPEDDFDAYIFTIRDYTGRLGQGTSYLEAWRVVNSTSYLIEKKEIVTTLNEEVLQLVIGKVYGIYVRFADDSTADFGLKTMTTDTTITLPILDLSFSQMAQSTYRYVTVEATRPSWTSIVTSYNDTQLGTNWANVTIEFLNGTVAASANYSTDSFTYSYLTATHNLTYKVRVAFDHDDFGLLPDVVFFLGGNVTYEDTPDVGAAGSIGGMDTTDLLGIMIIASVMGAGTYRNSEAVLIAAALITAMFSVTGFVSFDVTLIEVVIGIVIIYNLVRSAQ